MKASLILTLLLVAGCGGGQAAGPAEPDPVPPDPAGPEIVGPTHGLDASCETDDDCIVTTDSGNCGCCNCDVPFISSKKSYGWLMDEYAKEQCPPDPGCAIIDCEACPIPELGPAVCHEGTCGMLAP
jgi:hypothetical protein